MRNKGYIDALAEIQNGESTVAMLHRESNEIPIRKGVRQGDTISPRLFTATLEDLFRNYDWSSRGVSINGNKLSNLRFADDVTILAQDLEEMEISLNELPVASISTVLRLIWQKQKYFALSMSLKGQ